MDPIHPIIPVAPTIPTVTPAPLIGRIDRDNPRRGAGEDTRRRRRPQPQDAPGSPEYSHDVAVRDGDDDGGPHVNVTA